MTVSGPAVGFTQASRGRGRDADLGFTLVEIMLAILIFAGVVAAIYSSWSAILRSSRVGLQVAADAQRKRIAVSALEEALNSVQMFGQNVRYYSFEAETDRDEAYLSLVARLPRSFPRSGRFGDYVVRRLTFRNKPDAGGEPMLVMWQQPLLFDPDPDEEQNPLILARDVRLTLEFWGPRSKDWEPEWSSTNQLPRLVRFTLGFGEPGRRQFSPEDVVTRVVVLPSAGVPAAMQSATGLRGAPPPGVGPGGGPLPGSPGAGARVPPPFRQPTPVR